MGPHMRIMVHAWWQQHQITSCPLSGLEFWGFGGGVALVVDLVVWGGGGLAQGLGIRVGYWGRGGFSWTTSARTCALLNVPTT